MDITVGDDFLDLCDQKCLYKHVYDFEWLLTYVRLQLRVKGEDY